MKKSLFAALLLALPLMGASPRALHAQVPGIDRAVAPVPGSALAPPPGAPVSKPTEPLTGEDAVKAAIVFVQLVRTAVAAGTLGTVALAALAGTYLLMYLIKTALKGKVPDHYKKFLGVILGFLTILATVLGYMTGGPFGAGAAGFGAAASGLFHDVIDGIRGHKRGKS